MRPRRRRGDGRDDAPHGIGTGGGVANQANQTATGALTLAGGATGYELQYAVDTSEAARARASSMRGRSRSSAFTRPDGARRQANKGTSIARSGLQSHLRRRAATSGTSPTVIQFGPGTPLTLEVTDAPPNAELFNVSR